MDHLFSYLCIAASAFIVTYITVPFAKRFAAKVGAIDYPSARRINTKPIPRMGGIAIFLGLCTAVIVQYFGSHYLNWQPALIPHPRMSIDYPLLGLSVLVIFGTGFLDDIFTLRARVKLAGQIAGALIACFSGLVITEVVNPFVTGGEIELGLLAWPLTVFYLISFTNIINLIDGLDGLACGITCISSFALCSFAMLSGQSDATVILLSLAACCLAFLRYNFHPASIFLGDSGSLLLGFLLGVASLLNVSRTAAVTAMLMPIIVAGVPVLDTLSAIIRRSRAGVSVGVADKGHIHHRLIKEGFDQRQAVLFIYAWCAVLSLGAALINQVQVGYRFLIVFLLAIASFAVAHKLHLFEPVLRHHYNPATKQDELISPDDDHFEEETAADKIVVNELLNGNLDIIHDKMSGRLQGLQPSDSQKADKNQK